jgi:hypothetical protein
MLGWFGCSALTDLDGCLGQLRSDSLQLSVVLQVAEHRFVKVARSVEAGEFSRDVVMDEVGKPSARDASRSSWSRLLAARPIFHWTKNRLLSAGSRLLLGHDSVRMRVKGTMER